MGLGDIAKKAKNALRSERGEQVSDQVLDRGADLANRMTGGKHADKIERGRGAVDDRVGQDEAVGDRAGYDEATTTTTTDAEPASHAPGRHRADAEPDRGANSRTGPDGQFRSEPGEHRP